MGTSEQSDFLARSVLHGTKHALRDRPSGPTNALPNNYPARYRDALLHVTTGNTNDTTGAVRTPQIAPFTCGKTVDLGSTAQVNTLPQSAAAPASV